MLAIFYWITNRWKHESFRKLNILLDNIYSTNR